MFWVAASCAMLYLAAQCYLLGHGLWSTPAIVMALYFVVLAAFHATRR